MRLSWRDILESLQAQTNPTKPSVEAMGEQSIGNSRDRSFNRDLPEATCPLALLRTFPRVQKFPAGGMEEIGKERRMKKRYES